MARNVQLQDMVERFKAETGQSTLVSAGLDDLTAIKHFLRSRQEMLWAEYDWPHLQILGADSYISLAAGQRYYDILAGMSYEGIDQIAVWYNDQPYVLDEGITFDDYGQYNSDNDERSDPALKWDIRYTGSTEQIEIWPIPASNDMQIQIQGFRSLNPLVENSDYSDLDGDLIVLYAAADVLYDQKSGKADRIAKLAQTRLNRLKGRVKRGTRGVILRGGFQETPRRGPVIVVR